MPALFPSFKIFYLIPFLVRSFYVKPLSICIWLAIGVGFLIDLLSTHMRFGLMSLSYALTALLLYRAKKHFFEDRLTTLPIMTFFFSMIAAALQWMLLLILDRHIIPLSFTFILTDWVAMPLLDMAFAAISFSLPIFLFGKPVRKGSDYFLPVE
jgi:rod shape-determining protein MreD